MRLIPALLSLPILIAFAAAPAVADDTEAANPDWAIKPFSVVAKGGTALGVKRVYQYGENVLLNVETESGTSELWFSDGGTPEPVRYADGSTVSGDAVDVGDQETAWIAEITQGERYRYAIIEDAKATTLMDNKGAAVSQRCWFLPGAGALLVSPRLEETGEPVPLSVLQGNTVNPIRGMKGAAVTCERAVVEAHPDGRRMLHAVNYKDGQPSEHHEFWLEGATATPANSPKPPPDWNDSAQVVHCAFFADHTLVVAQGRESSGAWSFANDKYEPIVSTDGKPLNHATITPEMIGGACYLFASDPTPDDNHPIKGFVYSLAGNTATLLASPEKAYLGAPSLLDWRGPPIVLVQVDRRTATYWLIGEGKIAPITTTNDEVVRAPGMLQYETTANHKLLRFQVDKGLFWGDLARTTVTTLCPADNQSFPRYSPFHEVSGELFYISKLHGDQSVSVVRDGEAILLKFDDGTALSGKHITSAQAGDTLYVCVRDDDDKHHTYTVTRKD